MAVTTTIGIAAWSSTPPPPVIVRDVDDPVRDLIEPATQGTRHVLDAARRTPSVRRVVFTSSIVAIYGDAADMEQIEEDRFDESHWNTTSSENHQPYSRSKTLAERLAWEMVRQQDRWDLVVVNPGLVLGPGLSPHTAAEGVLVMRDFGSGYYQFGAPELEFAIVDVRDVAEGHLRAGLIPEAEGRHILVSETLSLIEMSAVLRSHFGDGFTVPAPDPVEAGGAHAGAATRDTAGRGKAQSGVSATVHQSARARGARHDLPARRGVGGEALPAADGRRVGGGGGTRTVRQRLHAAASGIPRLKTTSRPGPAPSAAARSACSMARSGASRSIPRTCPLRGSRRIAIG